MIARWEQGGSAPSLETLLELIGVCGFDLPLALAPRDKASLTRLRRNVLLSPERRVEQLLRARKSMAKGDDSPRFDPYAIIAVLERHRVAYVLVGGFARVIHGTGEITARLDVTPSLRARNLARLELALGDRLPTRRHDDLRRAATHEPIGKGLRPPVASAPDLARMLGALGREEDRATLLALRRLIQLERHPGIEIEATSFGSESQTA